jgi:hypothetical protein
MPRGSLYFFTCGSYPNDHTLNSCQLHAFLIQKFKGCRNNVWNSFKPDTKFLKYIGVKF